MSKHERKRKKKFLNRRAHKNRIYVATSWHATVMFSGIPLEKKNKIEVSHCTVIRAAVRFRLFFTACPEAMSSGEPEQTAY